MLEDFYLGNKKLWDYEKPEAVEEKAKILTERLKIPMLLSKVLAKRGFSDIEAIKDFVCPSIKNFHDPMLLPDMENAIDRILSARERKEEVVIYGDYDVDGVTATAMLVQFLREIGIDVSFYIPDRTDEGYGISEIAIAYLLDNPYDLMVTVDCGISAKDRLDELNNGLCAINRSMDIIITDHHQPDPDNLPKALAIVNPHLPDSTYPFTKLCGAGIAFKLIQALCIRLELGDRYLDFVDLAALGTVADIVELMDENRIIVWAGLKKIQRRPNLGIHALLKVAEITGRQIDSWLLAFILAPRVNAAGRMGDASRAVNMFTSQSSSEAECIARQMHQDNALRQKIQDEIFQKAVKAIEADPVYKSQKVIVVCGEGWHQGVVGIVASLLTERFQKPCFVLSIQEDIATGSARSVEGFNIYSAMEYCRELFVKFGGHEQAGGLTIDASNIERFRKKVNEFADKTLTACQMLPKIKIDAETDLDELSINTIEAIQALAPFGEGNSSPVFRLNRANVLQKKRIGASGAHLRLLLGTGSKTVQAIAFKMGELEPVIPLSGQIDLLYTPGINDYMGKRRVQLNVKAIRAPENEIRRNRALLEAAEKVECLDYDEEWLYNGINNHKVKAEDIKLCKEELAILYRYFKKFGNRTLDRAQLFHLANELSHDKVRMNYFKLLSGMFIFDELDIIRFSYTPKGDYDLKIPQNIEKVSLDDSTLYTFLQTVQQVAE